MATAKELTKEPDHVRAAYAAALITALGENPDVGEMIKANLLVSQVGERREMQDNLRQVLDEFGPAFYGEVLLFHQVAKTVFWGHAEALSAIRVLKDSELTLADLGWPKDMLKDDYLEDAVKWSKKRTTWFNKQVDVWASSSRNPSDYK